jgi:hypothetical protein
MGSIRLVTLSDFHKHGYDVEVWCQACGHKRIVEASALFYCGSHTITELERRMRCSVCKVRAAAISPTMNGPSGGQRRAGRWQDAFRSTARPEADPASD